MSKRTSIKTVVIAALAALAAAGAAANGQGPAEPTEAQPTGRHMPWGTWDNFDPVYNVCRGTDARCYNPWVTDRQNKVLIYTRTAGPRHANLGPALPAGRNPPLTAAHVVQNALIAWLAEQGVQADWTEDVTQLSGLNQYKAVIGFVGIHNAFGTEYNWPWYEGLLGNANYYDHGANQNGTVNIVGRDSSTAGLGSFPFRDEWYNLVPFPTRVKFLATVDENSLATKRTVHPGHGDFHPVA